MTSEVSGPGRQLLVLADRIFVSAFAEPVTALLLEGERVLAAGDAATMRAAASRADVLDLGPVTVTPGLTDAHVHLTEWALSRLEARLAGAESPFEAAERVGLHARGTVDNGRDPSGWLRGQGWNAHMWGGLQPHRSMLDAVVSDRPAAMQSQDLHSLWVNSAALNAAGITPSTADPAGGRIVRDDDGVPTGLLLESAGQLVSAVMPSPSMAETVDAVREGQADLHSLGVTGVHSFPGIQRPVPTPGDVLCRIRSDGDLRLRVLDHIPLDSLDAAIERGTRSGQGDAWLRTGAVKMFLDGALGSRTAWMRQPYQGTTQRGISVFDPDEFRHHVRRAAAAGIAVTAHAIGDAAVDLALDVLGDPDVAVDRMPHRIEHIQCCPHARLGDAAAAGIVCSVQPSHLMTDWRAADKHWGPDRCRGVYAFASLTRSGAVLAFGTDAPVESIDPRRGLAAAVHRTDTCGNPGGGWYPEERITTREALHWYTVGPALAAGLASPAGTLQPGAAADLVAWDRDPIGQPEALLDMRCVTTVVAGEVVHSC